MEQIKVAMRFIKNGASHNEAAAQAGIKPKSLPWCLKRAKDAGVRVKRINSAPITLPKGYTIDADKLNAGFRQPAANLTDLVLEILSIKHCTEPLRAKLLGVVCSYGN